MANEETRYTEDSLKGLGVIELIEVAVKFLGQTGYNTLIEEHDSARGPIIQAILKAQGTPAAD